MFLSFNYSKTKLIGTCLSHAPSIIYSLMFSDLTYLNTGVTLSTRVLQIILHEPQHLNEAPRTLKSGFYEAVQNSKPEEFLLSFRKSFWDEIAVGRGQLGDLSNMTAEGCFFEKKRVKDVLSLNTELSGLP